MSTNLPPEIAALDQISIDLPKPIAAYFTADKGDADAVGRCFTDDAVVKDEGQTFNGIAAIKQWKTASSKKYTYSSEPIASEHKDGKTIITAHLVGNFPGSPVDLRYFLGLRAEKIASLEKQAIPCLQISHTPSQCPENRVQSRLTGKAAVNLRAKLSNIICLSLVDGHMAPRARRALFAKARWPFTSWHCSA